MNKRAVSPLVATILLIAFAVSIGAVIMNWTTTSSGASADTADGECARVSAEIISQNGEKQICLNRNTKKLSLDIENGRQEIAGLRISYIGQTSDYIDFIQKVEAGVLAKIQIDYDPYIEGEMTSVKITPIVGLPGDYLYCTQSGETFQTISDCE